MSRVPLSYRDWWDDWDVPVRTSRLLDQHFGTGLRRNDLLSSFWDTTSPSVYRTGYVRPWRHTNVQRQDSGSTLNMEKDKFQVILDVQQFTPKEITVKTTDKFIIVEGKHEEKEDEHGFVQRQFVRKYLLPNGVNPNDVASSLSSDGLLTVCVPLKPALPPNTERLVPITSTGPTKDEKKDEKKDDGAAAGQAKIGLP